MRLRGSDAVRDDAELGPVRWCPTCAEWWPDDGVFWYDQRYRADTVAVSLGRPYVRQTNGSTRICKGCRPAPTPSGNRRYNAIRRRRYREDHGARSYHQCRSRSCIVLVPHGRDRCHGCDRRLAGPLTVKKLSTMRSIYFVDKSGDLGTDFVYSAGLTA